MKRRTFIQGGLASLLYAGIESSGLIFPEALELSNTAWADNLSIPLPIPAILDVPASPEGNLDGVDNSVHLNVQQGSREFFPGKRTKTYGYNGAYLGPTIRVRNGQHCRFRINNALADVTTLHWHGLHVPSQWDGGPRQPIAAGTAWNPNFTIRQEAATLWYHPHAMGLTGEQVYHGLAGLFLIEDEISDSLDIPKTYGVDDIPVILQDRRFLTNGQFAYVQNMHDVMNGVIGNYLLVNGALQPTLIVHGGLVRLRILNGSNSSIYSVGFDDQRNFQVIASDGGFLERPVPMDSIILSAGERVEVVVDLADIQPGRAIDLHVGQVGGGNFKALQIVVDRTASRKITLPKTLHPVEGVPEPEAGRIRRFSMETMSMGGGRMGMGMMGRRLTINGKKMDLGRIDEQVKLGSTEIWEITNRSAMMMRLPHSMHLHDVQFQILTRDGRVPPLHEQGRKDTVLIMPGETVRIISRFHDYTGVYMYHCHLLEHEDDGMMGQFEVVA